jgi:hypothetical protein
MSAEFLHCNVCFGWKADIRRDSLFGMTFKALVSAFALCIAASTPASAIALGDEAECFDAQIYASIVQQTPTDIPDCGPDCIVMRWPWILELDVKRVLKGSVGSNPLIVLTMQHTYYRSDLGARRWWLRRNSLGAFNVLTGDNAARLARCPRGTKPAKPYIHPPKGKTLGDLAREGEARYGKQQ